ncbi:ABC transporter ATP-binding protein [Corynebacterium accolens]|uniref:ABC transporter ATP-binding protein n=1 Tax=Corynebacterium accolens TaxID=38284 RepID=UPI00266F4D58|nr:ABC transporter ATP-binding protein [Corynebacterium accolens]WKS58103.1 ABC transporter ATP-binding protein [Corynebacterium accolens]
MLELCNLEISSRRGKILACIDKRFSEGSVHWVRGKSGAGKTTLLKTIAGLQPPSSGEVKLCGKSLWSISRRQRDMLRAQSMGVVFQDSGLIPCLTVGENLAFACSLSSDSSLSTDSSSLLTNFGIIELSDCLPGELSGGQRQRAAVATALCKQPRLILADEPTSALDEENAYIVLNYLSQYAQSCQAIALIVSHDERVAEFADHSLAIGGPL